MSCILVVMLCRMVMAMTPVCILGVILSVQPTFLFGGEQRLNTLGVVIAIAQVRAPTETICIQLIEPSGVCHLRAHNRLFAFGNQNISIL